MEINGGNLIRNDTNLNAMGGSEIVATILSERLDKELLKEFQIVNSRVRNIDETKLRIFLAHDLAGDPESEFLNYGGWKKFHKIIFVSNWQMQKYMDRYQIPWSHCMVIPNGIDPIEPHEKPKDVIRLGYWSTPHRGLNILVPVFQELCKTHDNIELDVFSSFELYGWGERDEPYKDLFDVCRNHPKINYHGSVPNREIREAVKNMHILAYPSIWPETSCIVLKEAMSAGMVCVHPNYGALYETGNGLTVMYQWHEDVNQHANIFYAILDNMIQDWDKSKIYNEKELLVQKSYIDFYHGWDTQIFKWNTLLSSLLPLERGIPENAGESFIYNVGKP